MNPDTRDSLLNRILTLEKEISKQKRICAGLYLKLVLKDNRLDRGTYEGELELLTNLQHELHVVKSFIEE